MADSGGPVTWAHERSRRRRYASWGTPPSWNLRMHGAEGSAGPIQSRLFTVKHPCRAAKKELANDRSHTLPYATRTMTSASAIANSKHSLIDHLAIEQVFEKDCRHLSAVVVGDLDVIGRCVAGLDRFDQRLPRRFLCNVTGCVKV